MSANTSKLKAAGIMAGLLVFIGLLGYWAWLRQPNAAASPSAWAQPPAGTLEETVPPEEPPPARTGLQRLRRTKTTLSEDEIARKSKEVEQRSMEVFMDIFQKKYQDALEKLVEYYTWTFEHGFASSAGVRSSFGLKHWEDLVKAYPPAADKLREMADAIEEAMRTLPMSEIAFDQNAFRENMTQEERDAFVARALLQEICNFNGVLGTNEKSMELLTDLAKEEPELALACWRGAEDMLYHERAYDLLQVFLPDLSAEYDRVMNTMRRLAELRPPDTSRLSEEQQAEIRRNSFRNLLWDRVGRLLDFGGGTDQAELVGELAAQAAQEFPDAADLFAKYQ